MLLLPSYSQIVDAVGHNESSPLRARAINSAHAMPHIMLWTSQVHNKVDLRSLVKTKAMHEVFKAWKKAQAQPGSAGAGNSCPYSVTVALSWCVCLEPCLTVRHQTILAQ
jgi:hypothetical protein